MNALVTSFILSQVFGVYLLIIAIVLLSRVQFYRDIINQLQPNNPCLILAASLGLFLGLLLIDLHNVWVLAPRVIITVLCWAIFIKSLLWLAMPEKMLVLVQKIYSGFGYHLTVLLFMIFGIILILRGFYLYEIHQFIHPGLP